MPILGRTRTLRSTYPSPGSARSPAPGYSASSAMPPAVTLPPRAGRTTPGPARSLARPGEARPSWPGMSATAASPTPCAPRGCQPSPDHQERAPITTASAPAAPATTLRSASSATGSSASSTAASKPAPPTTRQSPGRNTPRPSSPQLLDNSAHGVSEHRERILARVIADITRKKHLNPGAATGPTPGWSSEAATTPTGSNDPATTAPVTPAQPRSAWSTTATSNSQHDQFRLSGIATCKASSSRYVTALAGPPAVRQAGPKRACAVLPRGPQFPHKSAAGRRPPQEAHRRSGTIRYLAARSL